LRNGQNVGFGEGAIERRAAVAAGAEADELLLLIKVRLALVISPLQGLEIDELFLGRGFAGKWMICHKRSEISGQLVAQPFRYEFRQLTIRESTTGDIAMKRIDRRCVIFVLVSLACLYAP